VSALADWFRITPTAISQHLRLLEEAGLVRTEKLGRTRSCQLQPAGLTRLQTWLSDRRSIWERRLDDLAGFLGEGE
jgi:DNA-binding transcriptional ArsR family regulator